MLFLVCAGGLNGFVLNKFLAGSLSESESVSNGCVLASATKHGRHFQNPHGNFHNKYVMKRVYFV